MTVVLSEAQYSMLRAISEGDIEILGSSAGWRTRAGWLPFSDQDYSDLLALIAAAAVYWDTKLTELGADLVTRPVSGDPPTYG